MSVPTGSGKTYVAVEAARRAIAENRTVIYTSPLKALSNTKYTEFSKIFGPDQVGILTGDRRDNGQAPLLIMTTEILRNLLYDAGGGEIDVRLDTLGLVMTSRNIRDLKVASSGRTIIFAEPSTTLCSRPIGNPHDMAGGSPRSDRSRHLIRPSTARPIRAVYYIRTASPPLFRPSAFPPANPATPSRSKRLLSNMRRDSASGSRR